MKSCNLSDPHSVPAECQLAGLHPVAGRKTGGKLPQRTGTDLSDERRTERAEKRGTEIIKEAKT